MHAKRKAKVCNTLLVALWNHIRNLPLSIVAQSRSSTCVTAGKGPLRWLSINGEHTAFAGTNLDLVYVQERQLSH